MSFFDHKLDDKLDRRVFSIATGAAAATAAIAGVAPVRGAFARQAESTPEGTGEEGGPGLPPPPEGATVVAEGLWNPRNLAFADDGTLYIAENGIGGDEILGDPAATPDPNAAPPSTRGYSGQISQVSPDGTQSVFVEGLASYSDGAGPVGVTVLDGTLYVTIGGVATSMGMPPLPEENSVSSIDLATGEVTQIVSIDAYEVENNPDGTDVNPNLYGIAATTDGTLFVNDAGGNVLYTVDAASGELAVYSVVPDLTDLTGAEAGEGGPRQPVPTGVAVDADGIPHISLLSEGWPADGPSVLKVLGADSVESVATGLATVVDLAIGPDGHLYIVQLSDDFSGEQPAPGSVHRILADGTKEAVVEGLFFPHGLAFDGDGNLFVSTNALISAPGMPAGQVLRFEGIAALA